VGPPHNQNPKPSTPHPIQYISQRTWDLIVFNHFPVAQARPQNGFGRTLIGKITIIYVYRILIIVPVAFCNNYMYIFGMDSEPGQYPLLLTLDNRGSPGLLVFQFRIWPVERENQSVS